MKIYNIGNRIMNTYIYKINDGYVMIDTGYEHSLNKVIKKLNKLNINITDIKYVFLTHAHDDHAGFLNELLKINTELKVIISDKAMPTLKIGQNSFNGGCSTKLALVFCKFMAILGNSEHKFPKIEDKYDDRFITITNENINEFQNILNGEIIYTPGHTSDSISLILDDIILCGDAAMNGIPSLKRLIIWIEDLKEYEQSWDKIINTKANKIYPAHGKPFSKTDLIKYKKYIKKIKLYKLK